MANIPFKSITFPGLPNKYTVPEISNDLMTAGKAADAKATGDALSALEDAVGDELSDIKADLGNLSDLETKTKTNLVSAINEIKKGGVSNGLNILYLYGDEEELNTNWANRDKAKMKFRYAFVHVDDKEQKNGWCKLSLQGQTSIVAPKHNFNIQFFKDPSFRNKDKTNYYDFGKHPKFTIKANYIDYSQARNIVSARLWGDVVHSRADMRAELSDAPNHGAIDGRPIILYMNDRYYGLYTFNMPKEDWMLGLDEDNPLTIAVGAENGGDENLFKVVSTRQWTVEVPDAWTSYTDETTSETISSQTNFLAMMDFVVNSTDEEFVADIEEYFNLPSLIDYYIYTYCVANADTFNKNQLMCSWDCGKTWYFTAYDMDETFGIKLTGTASYDVDPLDTYDNRLFKRLETLFAGDIYDRYVELRSSIFSDAYMCREFELFFNLFPDGEKEKDKLLWTGVGNKNSSSLEFFETFIRDRMVWCDRKFERMNPDCVACTGVTLNANTMTFDDVGATKTLVATLSPSNTTETLRWSSSNPNIATISNDGVVTSVADGECIITATCGEYSDTCSVTVDLIEAPIGYTILPSLKINNAYFDTGIVPNENIGFACKYDASTTSDSPVYGTKIVAGHNYIFTTKNNAGQTTWYSGGTGTPVLGASYANGVHKVELREGLHVYMDDQYVQDISHGEATTEFTLLAFAERNSLGQPWKNNWNGRTCYWLKIFNGTTLIRHYIPVSRDTDLVLGFYDLVNDEFKTAVSGTFSL